MINRLASLLGVYPRELAGARMLAEIPLGAPLINRKIAEHLARSPGQISGVVVAPQDAGVLLVHLRFRSALVPPVTMRLVIVEQAKLPASPVLVMRWTLEGGLGWLARAASPALDLFQLLPPGVRVDGDLLGIDVAEVLRSKDLSWVMALLTRLEVSTAPAQVTVTLGVGM